MKNIILTLFFLTTSLAFAQTDSLKSQALDEVTVYSERITKNVKNLSNQVSTLGKLEIEFQNFQTTAEMLAASGKVFVQKSQQGAGSPTIRGFEASKVLLLVDGIRMNNLIFRAGHLQNIITVDENMLQGVEIFYGPSSTLFGSDALGGTVNMHTKNALFVGETPKTFGGNVITRYGSVNEEKSGYVDFNYASEKWASLTALSYNDFGDLKMGKKQNHNEPFFGERNTYVETINGVDTYVTNPDKYVQKFSGYTQYNFMQKLSYRPKIGQQHSFNLQYATSTNVPRYDRLTDASGTNLKNAEWYYGPQKRVLGVYTFTKVKAFLNSNLKVDVAYQNASESRHNRKFGNYNLQNRNEDVQMYSVAVNLNRKFTKGELFYGLESYYETLQSTAFAHNIKTGAEAPLDTRYPNGDNTMFRNDVYLSYNHPITAQTAWNAGARAGYTVLQSNIADNTFFPLPFSEINQKNVTYSATWGLVHTTPDRVTFKVNASSGFRVPNIDDLAKIFESGSGTVIVPNEDLKPEKTITTDLGVGYHPNKWFDFETTYYYTRYMDAIVTDTFTYNNQSVIVYNGSTSTVMANQNKGKAFVTGLSANVKVGLLSDLYFIGNFNYTMGRVVEQGNRSNLDHIPPSYGKLALQYRKGINQTEVYMLFNGKKPLSQYALNAEDNEVYAPKGGTPAWQTYNVKTSFRIQRTGATLYGGVENLLDTQYRVFASGINAPGRNIYGGLRYQF